MRYDYSVTSNDVKLYKHFKNLQDIQNGKASPIMFHVASTNRCDMKCSHCCFDDRNKNQELNFNDLKSAITQIKNIGAKAYEHTGGGEPTMYSNVNELIEFIDDNGFVQGMNTNGLGIDRVKEDNWRKMKWVRVAMNIFDSGDIGKIDSFMENVKYLKTLTKITACYIVPKNIGLKNLSDVMDFSNHSEIVTRIAPDCIQDENRIIDLTVKIRWYLEHFYQKENKYAFVSDFNIYTGDRPNDICMMHMIKPFLYSDGWVYACPSSELAIENGKDMNHNFRVCRMEDIEHYYKNVYEVFNFKCSYCKYSLQNKILNSVITETEDNEFA